MSTFVKHETPKGKGLGLAWLALILWIIALAVTWFAYRDSDGSGGGFINFLGRFHPLIVHMPIGFIFLAFIIEAASLLKSFSYLQKFQPFVLWLSFFSAIAATIIGYFLMAAEDFAGRAMDLHLYFGLAVVVCTLIALISAVKGKLFFQRIGVLAAVFTCSAAGHFGGAMVHTPQYLTEHAPAPLVPLLEIGLTTGESHESAPAEDVPLGEQLVYANFIAPMMAGKCNECHDANKTKGKLRTDTHELLLAGASGSDFTTVDPHNAEESELVFRSELPRDDDEAMPPEGDPLTPDEIQVLRAWIDAGATLELTVAQLGAELEAPATTLLALYSGSEEEAAEGAVAATTLSVWDTLEPEEQTKRLDDVKMAAETFHFSVMPISAEDDRLRINVINAAKEFGDDQLALLEPVADRIVWLDLARSQISDAGMETIGNMNNLERLHLENTAISDEGISKLSGLSQLEYLNLYNTKVGNGIFETFATLPSLKKVYVWQTEVEAGAARSFERSVNLEVNTGIELAAVTPVEEPAEETEATPEEKPAEPKPAAPKPAAPKPAEKKPEATPAAPTKPAAAKPDETKPAAAPAEKKPAAPKPAATDKKAEAKPAAKPANQPKPKAEDKTPAPKPAEKKDAPKPAETKPKPADTPPAEPKKESEDKKKA